MLAAALTVILPIISHAETLDPPENAVLAVLPFLDFHEDNRIYIDLAPENSSRRMKMILDTGATFSVVTPRAAREMGVRVRRTKNDPYRRKTSLGRDLLFYIDTKSSDQGSKTGWEYALIGGNFLKDYVLELDFENRRVRLLDPDEYEVPETVSAPDAAVIPLEIVSNRPTLFMEVNGHRSKFLFDTGAPLGTSISGAIASRSRVESKAYPGYRAAGVWGEVAAELGVADGVQVGPFRFGPVPIQVHPNGFFNFGVADQGIVGYDVMARFLVRIDYPRERLLLVRRPDWKVTWYAREWSGWDEYLERAQAEEGPAASEADFEPARAAEPEAEQQVWLELEAPDVGERREGRMEWVEVRGWAGVGTPVQHDLVMLVDVSGSTMWASGSDVDGDGKIGKKRRRIDPHRSFNPAHYSSDTGDTVLAAELLATRKLVELLDPDRTRIGLISFSSGAQVHARVGTGAAGMGQALEELEQNFGSGMTNMAMAMEVAIEALLRAGGEGRQKTMLILSDGYPTAPGSGREPAEAALLQAERARGFDVRIFTFGLGLEEADEDDVYARMASATGGEYRRLASPGEVVHELSRINLANVAGVELQNLSTGVAGIAVRVFPDGSFDGFVKLAAGDNRIRVTARGDDGGESSVERIVFFDPREPRDAAEAKAFDAEIAVLKAKLEVRAIETRLASEVQAGRASRESQRRELEMRAEAARPVEPGVSDE